MNVWCVPTAQKGWKPDRPYNWLGFKLDLVYVLDCPEGLKWVPEPCMPLHSRSPYQVQTDYFKTSSNLTNWWQEGQLPSPCVTKTVFHVNECLVFAILLIPMSLVVLHGSKCAWWCCLSSSTTQKGKIKGTSSHCWWEVVVSSVDSIGTRSRSLSLH